MKTRLFVTFEGIEGCGKSTQVAKLASRLRDGGYGVLSVREPGGTPLCEAIREILKTPRPGETVCPGTEALLFFASRYQLVREVILPALERGVCVLCDRFADSTTAYQAYGRELDLQTVLALNRFAVAGALPDLTVLMDVPVEESRRRVGERSERTGHAPDRIEMEDDGFHERVRQGYLEIARQEKDRFLVLDSTKDETFVHDAVWRRVAKILENRQR